MINQKQEDIIQKLNELTKKDDEFNQFLKVFNKELKTYKLKHVDHNKFMINKELNSMIVIDDNVQDDIDYTTTFQRFLEHLDNKRTVHIVLLMNIIPYYLMKIISVYSASNDIIVYLEKNKYNLWKESEFYDNENNPPQHLIQCKPLEEAEKLNLIKKML